MTTGLARYMKITLSKGVLNTSNPKQLLLQAHVHKVSAGAVHLVQGVLQEAVELAGKVGVQALVARDELVGEGEAGHEQALLQPKDGAEAAAEVDALHACKRHQPLRKADTAADPPLRPLRLLRHTRNRLDRLRRRPQDVSRSAKSASQGCHSLSSASASTPSSVGQLMRGHEFACISSLVGGLCVLASPSDCIQKWAARMECSTGCSEETMLARTLSILSFWSTSRM